MPTPRECPCLLPPRGLPPHHVPTAPHACSPPVDVHPCLLLLRLRTPQHVSAPPCGRARLWCCVTGSPSCWSASAAWWRTVTYSTQRGPAWAWSWKLCASAWRPWGPALSLWTEGPGHLQVCVPAEQTPLWPRLVLGAGALVWEVQASDAPLCLSSVILLPGLAGPGPEGAVAFPDTECITAQQHSPGPPGHPGEPA